MHVPVLLQECLEFLGPALSQDHGVLVDGTLGGGGHTKKILESFPNLCVLACDVDISAIEKARIDLKLYVESKRLYFFHGNFSLLNSITIPDPKASPPWNAVLLDLGYSSTQLEDPAYGMSFQIDAPLDMRLSRPAQGISAWELLCECTAEELAEIFEAYGEIPKAKSVAFKLKQAISDGIVTNSTSSLASYIASHVSSRSFSSKKKMKTHPATTLFQALRIAVNDELRNLDSFLRHASINLKNKGRLGIITFHSLEDRIVKQWGIQNNMFYQVTKKPINPSELEISQNPRSRSARLRVYEKVSTSES